MTVGQDDGGKVLGRIDRHRLESGSYLFERDDFDHHLLEERVPAGEIARHGVPPGCPNCTNGRAWRSSRGFWLCSGCRRQVSVLAGTVFQDTHLPNENLVSSDAIGLGDS
jgi:ribosomal protein L37AE/L43A